MTRKARAEREPLTIPQAAARLGVQRDYVYKLIRNGVLGCIELPGTGERTHRRVEQDELDRFLKDHRRKAATA